MQAVVRRLSRSRGGWPEPPALLLDRRYKARSGPPLPQDATKANRYDRRRIAPNHAAAAKLPKMHVDASSAPVLKRPAAIRHLSDACSLRSTGPRIPARSRPPARTSPCSAPPPPLYPLRKFTISPSAWRKQARPERRYFERSALAAVRGRRVDATLSHAPLCPATLCQRRRGCQFNHGVYA